MAESAFDAFHAEYRDLVAGAASPTTGARVPALLIRRAREFTEPLLGRRARFLMTSHSREGEWLAHGWKRRPAHRLRAPPPRPGHRRARRVDP
jgi:hypothetical protein